MSSMRLGKIQKFFRSISGKWVLERPFVAQMHEWEEWKTENKEKYPVRYFIQERLPSILYRLHKDIIIEPYWWIMYRFVKKHQYNVIRIRDLKPNYYDHDTRILYSVMQEVCDFWECHNERYDTTEYEDWELEIKKVYDYWKAERKELVKEKDYAVPDELRDLIQEKYGFGSIFRADLLNNPDIKRYKKCLSKMTKIDEKIDRKDKQHLRIVVKYLNYLWT